MEAIYLQAFIALAVIGFGLAGVTLYLLAKDRPVRLGMIIFSNLIWPFANFIIAPAVTPTPALYQAGVTLASLLALHGVILGYSIAVALMIENGQATKVRVAVYTVAAIGLAYLLFRLTL